MINKFQITNNNRSTTEAIIGTYIQHEGLNDLANEIIEVQFWLSGWLQMFNYISVQIYKEVRSSSETLVMITLIENK